MSSTNCLQAHPDRQFRLVLPDQNAIPISFHITEVAYVQKRFIDCGGRLHTTHTCQMQAWLGPDTDHRLQAGKMADVMNMAKGVMPEGQDLDIEIEYEDATISQYPVADFTVTDEAVALNLAHKHTDCLAKDRCLPTLPMVSGATAGCCGPVLRLLTPQRVESMRTVLFVCVHNAGRSQMAEAFTNALAKERGLAVRALSAGTIAGQEINPQAVAVMREIGVSMTGQTPKQLTQAMADGANRIITMGCGVDADACPARIHLSEDWGLDDPKGQSVEKVRAIRDEIKAKVEGLLDEWEKEA